MRIRDILPAVLLPLAAHAQIQTSATAIATGSAATGNVPATSSAGRPLGDAITSNATYISYASTITRGATSAATTGSSNGTLSSNGTSSSSDLTLIVGGTATLSSNLTSSSTSSAAQPTNTQPCNGYVEFCDRAYSNITYVAAHNFPFIRENNAARNQELGMLDQLNDGIRMLQAQAHLVNDTMYYCHSSCDILNAGPVEDQFRQLVQWLEENPYEVVTILTGNYNQVPVQNFTASITNSGLEPYLYIPPLIPMGLNDWPTTAELIITNKRVVYFLDYRADQIAVPYILDEFSQMWETPFSPQDPAFPCTVDRPPELSPEDSRSRMYLANHNLNVDLNALGVDILVPNVADINQTNAVEGNSSLGLMAEECTGEFRLLIHSLCKILELL
jgi:hypothetical protein